MSEEYGGIDANSPTHRQTDARLTDPCAARLIIAVQSTDLEASIERRRTDVSGKAGTRLPFLTTSRRDFDAGSSPVGSHHAAGFPGRAGTSLIGRARIDIVKFARSSWHAD